MRALANEISGRMTSTFCASPPNRVEVNVRNLSASEFNEMAVVSFLLDSTSTAKPKATASTLYVVDLWRQNPPRLMARDVAQPRHSPYPDKANWQGTNRRHQVSLDANCVRYLFDRVTGVLRTFTLAAIQTPWTRSLATRSTQADGRQCQHRLKPLVATALVSMP